MTEKSVILAPFNSTKSHLSDFHDSLKEMLISRKFMKLAAKCRDADR
jgi:hypothetical protein